MGAAYSDWNEYLDSLRKLTQFTPAMELAHNNTARYDILMPGHGAIDLEDGIRSVQETLRVVEEIVKRRDTGEDISGLDPFQWNWESDMRRP